MTGAIDAAVLAAWLADGKEIALLDVREHGQYGEGHPFFAVNAPYSRLELDIAARVPRLNTRIVLLDDNDGLAMRAQRRLRDSGYTNAAVLENGAPGWRAAGHTLFQGVNLPSKTFGEFIEQSSHTPSISAQEFFRRRGAGEPFVLVDGRTLEEHGRMTIPGATPVPNGELAARIDALLPDAGTTIVVHCAGRTRSIIGAQTLIELGVPNPVLALEDGTQGWRLAGFDLEHGSRRTLPALTRGDGRELAARRVEGLAARWRVATLGASQAQQWLDEQDRNTYVFDIRTHEEYAAGSLAGAIHVPGGQLIQAADLHVWVRNSRILLLDDGDGRAVVIAHWLKRLGFEAAAVQEGLRAGLAITRAAGPQLPGLQELQLHDLRRRLEAQPALLDLRPSQEFRRGHDPSAAWAIRPRLDRALTPDARSVVLIADDAGAARAAAIDLRENAIPELAWTRWSTWRQLGRPEVSSSSEPADAEAIDFLFFTHDRHEGNLEAARRYLEWETGLLDQCSAGELAAFEAASGPAARR
ncbi:rhodanese-like domain-containing protein [Pollutimonas bauzanensis]|uniref:Rhodanese-related sulfurtransferase n=1 Tax=Pollutimonas bauzanensis TaxID=658167 RepID=A0A1M5NJI8_9BURK|nr:rhodanese-like domain-containing protein [Pollutimonas bauzanensis]SHG89736.1 Rhodanese-related sulfurtransferase [Pollutimonas bauzanensis]